MIKIKPKDTEKRNKILVVIMIVVCFLLATLLTYLLFGRLGFLKNTLPDSSPKIGFKADANSTDGDLTGKSKDEIIAALNKKVKEGMNTLTMNPNPTFADGKSKGTLNIVNKKNYYPQVYEIYTKDSNQLIYSGGLKVGQKIETSTLLVDLPKGTYDCNVYFHLVDPSTDKRIGTSVFDQLIVTVQS